MTERLESLSSFYEGKRILITGGLGFIGSSIAHMLTRYDCEITLLDSMIPEYGGNLANIEGIRDRVQINFSDMRDPHTLPYLVNNKDCIFNMAGTLSHVDSMRNPFTDLDINCRSQLSLLEILREVNPTARVVFAGTRGQYGAPSASPVNEACPQTPIDVNGINNIAGESYHLLYNRCYGIPTCSLRLSNTYGPRHQMKHHKQGVLSWFVRKLIDDEEVTIFGDGSQIRDTVYVDDVCNAFLIAMACDACIGKAYNIGAYPTSLKEFVETAIRLLGRGQYGIAPFPDNLKRIEIGNYIADTSLFRSHTGWEPEIDLETGIRRTLDFYLTNRDLYWS